MLRQQREFIRQVTQYVDLFLIALTVLLAHWLRWSMNYWFPGGLQSLWPFENYVWIYLLYMLLWRIGLELQGYYQRAFISDWQALWVIAKGIGSGVLIMMAVLFVLRRHYVNRSLVAGTGVAVFLVLSGKHILVRRYLIRAHERGRGLQNVMLVGGMADNQQLADLIRSRPEWGLNVVGVLLPGDRPEWQGNGDRLGLSVKQADSPASEPLQPLGVLSQITSVLHRYPVDYVLFNVGRAEFDEIEEAILACEIEGVETWLIADFFRTSIARASLDEFHGIPMLIFRTTPAISWQLFFKRAIDLLGASLLIVLTAPVMLPSVLLIRLTSPGPVLFKQKRSGLHGRQFTMYKFRSMVTNAEMLKTELQLFNEMSGPVFKLTNDPRVTPFGRFMRRWSIDELPQLFNVLQGDMSLVGPRPLPVYETERFDDPAQRRRLSVKPGLTCLWQISGRNEINFQDWIRLDLKYIDNWSLWLDVVILLRTLPVVVRGVGAR